MITRTMLAEIREDDIRHDPYGTAFSHCFALCEMLALAGFEDDIPAEVRYRPGVSGPSSEDYWTQVYAAEADRGHFSLDDACRAILILSRYINFCRLAGRDY